MVQTRAKMRREQRCSQCCKFGATRGQTTGTSMEEVETAYQGGHGVGRGHCGYGPRSEGEEGRTRPPPRREG